MRIRHRGLRELAAYGRSAKVPPNRTRRLLEMLAVLRVASDPSEMDIPGYRLHPLRGDRAGFWSVRVTGNWRLVFRFEAGEAVDIDLVDYH